MDFNQMGKLMQLAQQLDVDKIIQLSEKVDLGEMIGMVAKMDEAQVAAMTKMLKGSQNGERRQPPAISGDFYDLASVLSDEQRDVQQRVRTFMGEEVKPIINEYWQKETFPRELIGKFQSLDLVRAIFEEDGTRKPDASVTEGIVTMEMARVDVSTATFFGVHAGLALWSVLLGGSDEQQAEWLPKMLSMEVIGAFGLTEPKVGSGVAGGLTTTCRRDGDAWVLNGQKKWIGNATFADFVVIWARDEEDGEVKGFIVRADTPGYTVEQITGKIALRAVENGLITLEDCRVPEADRLQEATSWRVIADVLRATRAGVAWQGIGCAMGAYELAQAYSLERKQFGKYIGGFQLVQERLAEMLGHVTATQWMGLRLSQMQDAGTMKDEHASLAKVHTAAACRRVVALGRGVFGGNGILLDHHIARLFCDAEAIYSYEGTHEINSLVVGRAITGFGAFV